MSGSTALDRSRIAHDETAIQLWRDWRRYLQARLELLEVQRSGDLADFEQDPAGPAAREQAARATIAALPAAYRRVCEQLVEERRQQTHAAREQAARAQAGDGRPALIDPDASEREALHALLAEAEGRASLPDVPAGWGLVPTGTDQRWWAIDVAQARSAPGAASYDLEGGDELDTRKRLLLAAALTGAAVLFLTVWVLWPKASLAPLVADPAAIPLVNGTPTPPWTAGPRVGLTYADGTTATIPLSPTDRLDPWPQVAAAYGRDRALLRAAAAWPINICLPADALPRLSRLTLAAGHDGADRVYLIQASAEQPDLHLAACEAAGAEALPAVGVLQDVAPPRLATPGEAVTLAALGGVTITLREVAVIGSGQDPALPADRAELRLIIVSDRPEAWMQLPAGLLLASGAEEQARPAERDGERWVLRYLIPLPTDAGQAVWRLRLPDGTDARWLIAVAPPPSRDAMVWRHLATGDLRVDRDAIGQWGLALTLRNTAPTPLQLRTADVQLSQQGSPVLVDEIAALRTPLAPDEARRIAIPLPQSLGQGPLILTLGATRVRIDLTR